MCSPPPPKHRLCPTSSLLQLVHLHSHCGWQLLSVSISTVHMRTAKLGSEEVCSGHMRVSREAGPRSWDSGSGNGRCGTAHGTEKADPTCPESPAVHHIHQCQLLCHQPGRELQEIRLLLPQQVLAGHIPGTGRLWGWIWLCCYLSKWSQDSPWSQWSSWLQLRSWHWGWS